MNQTNHNKKQMKQNFQKKMRNRRAKNMVIPLLKTFSQFSIAYSQNKSDEKEKINLLKSFRLLTSHLDKLVQKKIFSKKKVARKKSTIQKQLSNLLGS